MIIECYYCETKVDGTILSQHNESDHDGMPCKISLLECPVCKNAILAYQELVQIGPEDSDWCDAVRLWPEPKKHLDWDIPDSVRNSLEEAQLCYKGKAFSACAVMCGRVLESICSEHKTKNKYLAGGLKELLDQQLIDKRMYEWSEELREHRNIGAHHTTEKISKDDAKDLLDFAIAICDYIFVLTAKFKRFMERKGKGVKISS